MIQPKIDYAISIWGYTSRQNLNIIERLQNRAARIITGNHDYVNTRGIELVKTLKWVCVSQRRYYFMLLLMFKSIHGLAPDCNMQRDICQRPMRSQNVNNDYVPYDSLVFLKYVRK